MAGLAEHVGSGRAAQRPNDKPKMATASSHGRREEADVRASVLLLGDDDDDDDEGDDDGEDNL